MASHRKHTTTHHSTTRHHPSHHATGSGPGIHAPSVKPPHLPGGAPPHAPSDPNFISIYEDGKHGLVFGLEAMLTDASPVIVMGGGWEDVARPLRRGIPQWRGMASATLPLSLLITNLGRNVERECEALEHMAGALSGPKDPEPPQLRLYGKMLPREAKSASRRWVIQDPPSWDTSPAGVLRHPQYGYRTQQAVDITLLLLSDDELLQSVHKPKSAPRIRHIRARDGDSFEKIAKRELGNKRFAHKLAQLNGKGGGSVSTKLKKGTDVKIPTGTLLAQWRKDLKAGK